MSRRSCSSPVVVTVCALTLSVAAALPATEAASARREVRVLGYHFDPLVDGEPQLSAALRAPAGTNGFRLVQLTDRTRQEWLTGLDAAGARVLQYYPHDTFLVWLPAPAESSLAALPFVRWQGAFHPAYKLAPSLAGRSGRIDQVDVMFYAGNGERATLDALAALGAELVVAYPSQPDGTFWNAIVRLDAGALAAVARRPEVLWLGYQSPKAILDDEMSSQIVAGNTPGGVPVTGYEAWLAALGTAGYTGAGVIWSITDTGVDYTHMDLGPRIVGGYNYPGCPAGAGPGDDPATGGHGTHVAGIVGGDASGGFMDGGGFLYGLGIAPGVSFFAQNPICSDTQPWPPAGGWQELSKRGVLGGAIGANNSWTSGEGTNHGYQATERTHDFMARDGNFDTPGTAEPYILVFSAGNSGPGASTLTSPKEAKNVIVTGGTQNYRVASNIDAMYGFSSRGPTVDGRYGPTIVTPGQQIASTRNNDGGDCASPIAGTSNLYAFCSGTSMASPHASGSVALLTEWWRDHHAGATESPAMAKALLVNGAVDISGAPSIPNTDEGWGRINLTNVLDNPLPAVYRDQLDVLDNPAQQVAFNFGVADPGEPLKVTIAWSDAPGAVGANPALVNNLDLVVETDGNTYLGNRFVAGWSATGGTADTLNNVENVFVQTPGGTVTITITATNLPGDGIPLAGDTTDQDFALVCSNCLEEPTFSLDVTPLGREICTPADATYDITVGSILGFTDPVTLSLTGEPAGTTVGFSTNPVTPPDTSTLTIGGTGAAAAGAYPLTLTGTAEMITQMRSLTLEVFTGPPGVPTLLTPANGATNQPLLPTLGWSAAPGGGSYTVEVATDAGFANIVASASGLDDPTYEPAGLVTNTEYFWRVRASNACGVDTYTTTFSFVTKPPPGECSPGTGPVARWRTGFESGTAGWASSGTGNSWALSSARTHSGTNAFHANDPAVVSDQYLDSPPLVLPIGAGPLALRFWHHQTIEDRSGGCYDGAVLELSTDGGSSWTRLESEVLIDPYDGPVSDGFANPIGGQNAWCGDPQDWTESIVDLDAWAGATVRLRFRLASDNAVSREGWYVDDLELQSCNEMIFADGFESGNTNPWSLTIP